MPEFRGLAAGSRQTWAWMCRSISRNSIREYLLKNLPITPVATLERAKAIADAEGLHYVYIGNVPGHPGAKYLLPECRRMLVERVGFDDSSQMLIRKGRCLFCEQPIPGVWHA